VVIAWLWLACGPSAPCPEGSMASGPGGLEVTEAEHPTGYGDSACLQCHAVDTLHDAGCTAWVDPVALRAAVDEAVATEGEAACKTCHGPNGVAP
jgi:hypothetical protein